MKIAYFVQDLNDPAVVRRVQMLAVGGAKSIIIIGFWRSKRIPANTIAGFPVVALGCTRDHAFIERSGKVLRTMVKLRREVFAGTTIMMARGLEMLALAFSAKRRFARDAALVYEVLDIQKIMYMDNFASVGLRMLEKQLMRQVALLVISSPAYEREFFRPRYQIAPPTYLVENKILQSEFSATENIDLSDKIWRIGWFGKLRCERSLHMLDHLAKQFPGRIEVIIRGKMGDNPIPNFDSIIAANPGLSYHGPYERSDLSAIYRDVHFVSLFDYSDSNHESEWCLVNRMYEAGSHGCIPIGVRSTEGGRWLTDRKIGLVLGDPVLPSAIEAFQNLTPESYLAMRSTLRRLPLSNFVAFDGECINFITTLEGMMRM